MAAQVVLHQQGNVRAALAQGREANVDHPHSMEQSSRKLPSSTALEIAMGRGHYPRGEGRVRAPPSRWIIRS